jgi:hypothetical protein
MGYYVHITDSNAGIGLDEMPAALDALRALDARDDLKSGGSSAGDKWFSWMNDFDLANAPSVASVLERLGFDVDHDSYGGLSIIGYDNKKGDEGIFIQTLAPFIESGSYIEWQGEDSQAYRWGFHGGEMETQYDRRVPSWTVMDNPIEAHLAFRAKYVAARMAGK